jgi:hypothetical protein
MSRYVVAIMLCFLAFTTVQAAGRPEIRFSNTSPSIGCASGATFVRFAGSNPNVDNALNYGYEGKVFAAGSIYEHSVGSAPGSIWNSTSYGWVFEQGNTGGSANALFPLPPDTPYTLRMILFDTNGSPSWVAVVRISKCNGGSIVYLHDFPYPSNGLLDPINDGPPDDRINWHYGDAHIGILYPGNNGAINLYSYADDAYIFDFVTTAMLAPYANALPSSNVLLAEHGQIRAYLLSSGEIQFNLGPDAEGKWYEVILDSLADRDIRAYAHDPNE